MREELGWRMFLDYYLGVRAKGRGKEENAKIEWNEMTEAGRQKWYRRADVAINYLAVDGLTQRTINGRLLVHGHEQSPAHPAHYSLRHNYDTFAWYTGRLVVGVWDETGTDPVDNIEIRLRTHIEKQLDDERWIK